MRFLELHMLQNFGPSNLNRNDTNAPKDCTFGGFRRARISSQCIKRSIRRHQAFKETVLEAGGNLGSRTKRITTALIERLADQGRDRLEAEHVAENLLRSVSLDFDKKSGNTDEEGPALRKTQYLLFLSESEIEALGELADRHWDALIAVDAPETEDADKRKRKKAAAKAVPKEVQQAVGDALRKHPRLAADIALFGRMVADAADMNIDAACQVAHAISTNEVSMEMDFYTAVDDLKPDDEAGSDMLGIVEFNSACYYRYAQVNLGILQRNLGNDAELVRAAVRGFLRSAVQAIPTGMQNSMAAHNPPSYVRVLLRSQGAPWSLANAFLKPVRVDARKERDLVGESVDRLEKYLDKLKGAYGDEGFELDCVTSLEDTAAQPIPLKALMEQVDSRLAAALGGTPA